MSEINQIYRCWFPATKEKRHEAERLVRIVKIIQDKAPFIYQVEDVLTGEEFEVTEGRIRWSKSYNEMEVIAWAARL
jgi:hypothetical protein